MTTATTMQDYFDLRALGWLEKLLEILDSCTLATDPGEIVGRFCEGFGYERERIENISRSDEVTLVVDGFTVCWNTTQAQLSVQYEIGPEFSSYMAYATLTSDDFERGINAQGEAVYCVTLALEYGGEVSYRVPVTGRPGAILGVLSSLLLELNREIPVIL